jgi:hypothetical protein
MEYRGSVANVFEKRSAGVAPALAHISPDRAIPPIGFVVRVVAPCEHVPPHAVFAAVGSALPSAVDAHAATVDISLQEQISHASLAKAHVASHDPIPELLLAVREKKRVCPNFVADLKGARAEYSLAFSHYVTSYAG